MNGKQMKNKKIREEIINSEDKEYKTGIYKIETTNKNRKFVNMNNKRYLLKDEKKLLIENEFERMMRRKNEIDELKSINSSEKASSSKTVKKTKTIDELYNLINKNQERNEKQFEKINKNIKILDNNIRKVKDKVIKLEEEIYIEIDNLKLEFKEKTEELENKILHLELNNIEEGNTSNTDKNNNTDNNNNKEESELESVNSNIEDLEVLNIDNSDKDNSEIEYRFTNHSENELTDTNKTNNSKEINVYSEGETSNKSGKRHYKDRPVAGSYINQRKGYTNYNKYNKLWDKRLQEKYKPKYDTDPEILDLDCQESIENTITSWVGKTNARLIENKISLSDSFNYIIGTITGQARTYLNSLENQEKQLLEGHVNIDGNVITTSTEMLRKIEIFIRREFGDLNADTLQQEQEKINALNTLKGMELCSLCEEYLETYICVFRDNYYKAKEFKNVYLKQLFFDKLPYPVNLYVTNDYNKVPRTDTLGERISFLKTWYKNYCLEKYDQKKIKNMISNINYCCKDNEPLKIGCKLYYRKSKKHKQFAKRNYSKKYKKRRFSYYKKNPKNKYFVKKKDYKKMPVNPKTCRCYSCGKIGHISRDCKKKKDKLEQNYIDINIILKEIDEEIIKEFPIYSLNNNSENYTSSEENNQIESESNFTNSE